MAEKQPAKKAKGKLWFTVLAPAMFKEQELGSATSSTPEALVGRKITANLATLSDNMNSYYIKFAFLITKVDGDRAFTEFSGSECMRDYISRMILRRVKRIDSVQNCVTKDGKKIRVKCLAVVRGKVKSSIMKVIRSKVVEIMKASTESSSLDEFLDSMISEKLKNEVLMELRKIYPVRNFEVRKIEVI